MALDLSKPKNKAGLGRGKVPEDVKRRLDGEQEGPDTDPAIVHKIRRMKRGGEDPRKFVEQGLRETGGVWKHPHVETTTHPESRRRKQRYEDMLVQEQALPNSIRPLVVGIRTRLVRRVPSLRDEIDVGYNQTDYFVEMVYKGQVARFPAESFLPLGDEARERLVDDILIIWGFKPERNRGPGGRSDVLSEQG